MLENRQSRKYNYLDHNHYEKAGIILFYTDMKTKEMYLLILKGICGKWTFPKGQSEHYCSECQTAIINQEGCHPGHECQPESILQCAQRELWEETGLKIDLKRNPIHYYRRVCGRNNNSGCVYIVVEYDQKAEVILDLDEISDFEWVNVDELSQKMRENYYQYNMGIRKMMPYLRRTKRKIMSNLAA